MSIVRRPISVFEIVQPLCANTFGTSPCLATGTKCYNTDQTCAYRAALDMTDELRLQFVTPAANQWIDTPDAYQTALAIPALIGYSTAPTVLNVAGASESLSPLGYRAVANITLKDFPWNDVGTDPYMTDRGYDPATKGTFWGKWLARNPFYVGYEANIYEGFEGDALGDMIKRQYFIDSINRNKDGVSISAKDVLRKITDNKVQVPALSPGLLSLDITDVATSFEVAGAVLADYPSSGYVRINSEIIAYTATALVGTNVEFSGLTRAQLGSEADDHSQYDTVQEVLAYEDVRVDAIIEDILTRAGIDAGYIPTADWTAEADLWRPTYIFTGYVVEPEDADALVGDLCISAGINVWWDERTQEIRLKALRPDFAPRIMTDDANIIAGSFSMRDRVGERVSRVDMHFGVRNWAESLTDSKNYSTHQSYIDVNKSIQYDDGLSTRTLYSRWITTSAIAISITDLYLERFKDTRRELTFELAEKDVGNFWTGDTVNIEHYMLQDANGDTLKGNWLIISASPSLPGGRYRFTAEDNGSQVTFWTFVDENDYPATWADASEDDRTVVGYWLNDDGTDAGGTPRDFRWI